MTVVPSRAVRAVVGGLLQPLELVGGAVVVTPVVAPVVEVAAAGVARRGVTLVAGGGVKGYPSHMSPHMCVCVSPHTLCEGLRGPKPSITCRRRRVSVTGVRPSAETRAADARKLRALRER